MRPGLARIEWIGNRGLPGIVAALLCHVWLTKEARAIIRRRKEEKR